MPHDQTIRVLLIDDDEDEYVLVRSLFAKTGRPHFALAWTPDYDDALDRIRRREHDVYLLDYQLGARSGLDLLSAAMTGGAVEPVIVLTGQRDVDLDAAVLQAGASDFIAKQELSPPLLDRAIRYAVERAKGSKLAASLREQRETEEVRERLLGIVGHDLRNPLSAITTAGHLLSNAPAMPREAQQRIARTIVSSANRMKHIIDELLDFTRGRLGGGIPIAPKPIDLHDVCRRVLDEFRVAYPERQFQFSAMGDLRGCWDPERMAQSISNLTGNAIEHGDAASPIAIALDGRGVMVSLKVHNQGRPIAPELARRLFDPFRRGPDDAGGGKPEGLGLGLYITQQIVAGHGGTVTVESSDSGGTTFTVTVPRDAPSGDS